MSKMSTTEKENKSQEPTVMPTFSRQPSQMEVLDIIEKEIVPDVDEQNEGQSDVDEQNEGQSDDIQSIGHGHVFVIHSDIMKIGLSQKNLLLC